MRRPPLLLAGLALTGLVVGATPAQAAEGGAAFDRVVAAFRQICLDKLDDTSARVTVAQAAPWSMIQEKANPERYRAPLLMLSLSTDDNKSCSVTGEVDPSTDLETAKPVLLATVPVDAGKQMQDADTVMWLVAREPAGQRYVIAMKVALVRNKKLATLNVTKLPAQ